MQMQTVKEYIDKNLIVEKYYEKEVIAPSTEQLLMLKFLCDYWINKEFIREDNLLKG